MKKMIQSLFIPVLLVGFLPIAIQVLIEPEIEVVRFSLLAFIIIPAWVLLLYCGYLFARKGRSIAPWEKSESLITDGPYTISRNPIFVAMLAISFGWSLMLHSPWIFGYSIVLFMFFRHRILKEEIELRKFNQWEEYRRNTPRWIYLPCFLYIL